MARKPQNDQKLPFNLDAVIHNAVHDMEVIRKAGTHSEKDRTMKFLALLDVDSIGLFFEDSMNKSGAEMNEWAEPDIYGPLVKRHLAQKQQQHFENIKQKYADILYSFRVIDHTIISYMALLYEAGENMFHKYTEQMKRNNLLEMAAVLHDSATNSLPFESEFGVFYVLEWDRLGHDNMLNAQAHYENLMTTLQKTQLRTTFLASAHNDFKGCPFHIISKLMAIELREKDGGGYEYAGRLNGALMPFLIEKVRRDRTREPAILPECPVA